MKILILGAGQVGGSLAETLNNEEHEITLVDLDEERLQYYADRLDIRTLRGYGCYPGILRQAGADNADMVIATTDNDEVNIVACQIAYTIFNVPVKLARIRSRHYFVRKELFTLDHIPIDFIVSPELIVTNLITELMEYPGALRVMDFAEDKVKMVALKTTAGAPLVGKTVSEIDQQLNCPFRLVSICRGLARVVFDEATEIQVGDEVYFISASDDVKTVIAAFRTTDLPFRKILIIGGGNIGGSLARALQDDYEVKLIDHNRGRCRKLSNGLRDVTVLCGDANDSNLLRDENIENVDAFIAVTSDDEANIISSIQAKQLGARRTFALINRTDYYDIIQTSAIDVRLSPPIATTDTILGYVRRGDIRAVYSINRGKGEVLEAVLRGDKKTTPIIGRSLGDLKLPKKTHILALVREGALILTEADFVFAEGDRVIFYVADKRRVTDVEKLLQVSSGYF